MIRGGILIILSVWRGMSLLNVGELLNEFISGGDTETSEGNGNVKGEVGSDLVNHFGLIDRWLQEPGPADPIHRMLLQR